MPATEPSTTALLLRHAESAFNAAPDEAALSREQGDRLSERGREEAGAAAEGLRECGAARLLCSPLRRAAETGAPLAESLGLEPESRSYLHEVGEGGGGESFEEVIARVRLLKEELEARPGERTLLVTHGIFKRYVFFETLLGTAFGPDHLAAIWNLGSRNCGLSVFELGERPDPRDPVRFGWRCLSWMGPPSCPPR